MPMQVLFTRTPGFVALACWFITMSQFGIIFNIPLYFTAVEQTSSSYAGLHLIPNAIVASACSLSAGLIMARVGRYKAMLTGFGACAFVGPLIMCFWKSGHTSEWVYWITMPWNGAAYGGILTITLVALIASIEPSMMAAATGVTYLFRATGSVLGISLSNAVLQSGLQKNLKASGLPSKVIAAIRKDVNVIRTLNKSQKQLAIGAMENAFHGVFIAITIAAFLAFLFLLPIQEFILPGRKTTPAPGPQREQAIAEEDEE
jgi:tetrahydromethanopterin S-methyltransferase subunit B